MIPCQSTQKSNSTLHRTPVQWRTGVNPLTNETQRLWLARAGALTEGLRALGCLELEVLRETVTLASPDECLAMNLPTTQRLHIREVCMHIDQTPCVVARSLLTPQGYSGAWQSIRRLGKRPLADLLYRDRRVTRSHFETARVNRFHPLGAVAAKQLHTNIPDMPPSWQPPAWARRSVFWREGEPLLVSECFLSAFWVLTDKTSRQKPQACERLTPLQVVNMPA